MGGVVVKDVLKANLVLVGVGLLGTATEFNRFSSEVDGEVIASGQSMSMDAQTNLAEPGRLFSLDRDRITLDLSRSRSTIARDYPREDDLGRLVEVAWCAINCSEGAGGRIRATGYNLELVFDQTSGEQASRYLARRLFGDGLRDAGLAWELVGGAGRMSYWDGQHQWNIGVEPRFNDPTTTRVFLTVNMHRDGFSPSSSEEIKASLGKIWRQGDNFIRLLDGKENAS